MTCSRWTPTELARIAECAPRRNSWAALEEMFPDRTITSIHKQISKCRQDSGIILDPNGHVHRTKLEPWTLEEDVIVAGLYGPSGRASAAEVAAALPGRTREQARGRWACIGPRAYREGGEWRIAPVGAVNRSFPRSVPRPRGYKRAILAWAARHAPRGDMDAIAICGMAGVDMRPLIAWLGLIRQLEAGLSAAAGKIEALEDRA